MFGNDWGEDVIKGFEDGIDIIDFSKHTGVTSFSDLEIVTDGTNTYIKLVVLTPDLITLTDFNGTLTQDDFNFV